MVALAAYGSDISSSGDEGSSAAAGRTVESSNDRKRPRPEEDEGDIDLIISGSPSKKPSAATKSKSSFLMLPPPPLSDNSDCMVNWSNDYISHRHNEERVVASALHALAVKNSQQQRDSYHTTVKNYAEEIRADPSFHNPHQFGAVVEDLGIGYTSSDVMGSNMSALEEKLQAWELKDLERREIEARRRKQQDYQYLHQPPASGASQFAQEQLERALQQR